LEYCLIYFRILQSQTSAGPWKYKATSNPSDYSKFCRLRKSCKQLSSECHQNYISHANDTIPCNIRSFWSFVNKSKKSSESCDSYYLDDKFESSPEGICNLFADHFSSVYSQANDPIPHYNFDGTTNLFSCVLSEEEVGRKLAGLDPNKGTGPDDIPPSVLKYCSGLLAPHLTVIFNKLLELGIFPDKLKSSYVVPIHKSSDKANIRNYRPICIQPALGKVFESLVLDSIIFSCKSITIPEQHGFTSGKSTITNLVMYEEFILSAFRDGKQVDSA